MEPENYNFERVDNGKNWKIYKLDQYFSLFDFNQNERVEQYAKNNVELRLQLGVLQYEELLESLKPIEIEKIVENGRWLSETVKEMQNVVLNVERVLMKKFHVIIKVGNIEKERDIVYFKYWDSMTSYLNRSQRDEDVFKQMQDVVQNACWKNDYIEQCFDIESYYKVKRWILKYKQFSLSLVKNS